MRQPLRQDLTPKLLLLLPLLAAMQGPPTPPPSPRDVRPQAVVPQPPRDPREAGQPVAVGKGTISGLVVVAGSNQPARRARVSLSGAADVGGSRSMGADDQGRFAFTALPAGRYSLSASKPGHLNASYGQRRPGRPGTPIELAEAQRLDVQIPIYRGGVITGTVLDEHGDAIPATPVRVLRYVLQGGQRTLQSGGNGQTDDRGVYRIYGLQPGDYLVYATPRNSGASADMERMQVEMKMVAERVTALNATNEVEARVLAERLGQMRATMPASSDEQINGYAPVYYPGTTAPASAQPVALGPAEEKGNVDFQFQLVPIARIEGVVTSVSSQVAPQNVQITLVNSGDDVPGISPGSARADRDGNFRISNVPPGQYALVARATIGGGRGEGAPPPPPAAAGRGRGGAAPPAEPVRLWGIAHVSVEGRNVSNVVLTLQAGLTVSGRIAFDGTIPPPADLSRLRVSLSPIVTPGTPGEIATPASGRVDATGRFTINSVIPGKYRLSASGAGNGWYLGSAVADGHDSLDFPLEVKPSQAISSAVITFTDRQAELTGSIVNDQAQPASDYTLVLYSADKNYWTPQSRRIMSTRPATDGRFTFRNPPPGDYRLAPVFDPEPGSWFDPAFLQQLDATALRVTIAEGEKKVQNLRVANQ